MKHVYRVNCEWDIGLADVVFKTAEAAEASARQELRACGIDDAYDDLEDDGLVSVEPIEVRE